MSKSAKVEKMEEIETVPDSGYRTIKFKVAKYMPDNILKEIRSTICRVKQAMIGINMFMLFHIIRGFSESDESFNSGYRMFALNQESMRKIFIQLYKEEGAKKAVEKLTPILANTDRPRRAAADKRKMNQEDETVTKKPKLENHNFDNNFILWNDFKESLEQFNQIYPDRFKIDTIYLNDLMDSAYNKYETAIKNFLSNQPRNYLNTHFKNIGLTYTAINELFQHNIFKDIKSTFDSNIKEDVKIYHQLWHNSRNFETDELHLKNRLLIIMKLIGKYEFDDAQKNTDQEKTSKNNVDSDSEEEEYSPGKLQKNNFDMFCNRIESVKALGKTYNQYIKEKNANKEPKKKLKPSKDQIISSNPPKTNEESKEKTTEKKKKIRRIKTCVIPIVSHSMDFIEFSKTTIVKMIQRVNELSPEKKNQLNNMKKKEDLFDKTFKNEEMLKKFGYNPNKYKATYFSTDGLIVNLTFEKKKRSSEKSSNNLDNLAPKLKNIISIDPGVTDFLTLTQFKCDSSAFKPYPSENNNETSILSAKPDSIPVVNKIQKFTPILTKTKHISTKQYYNEIRYNKRRLAHDKFDEKHIAYKSYIEKLSENLSSCNTVKIDKLKTYIW